MAWMTPKMTCVCTFYRNRLGKAGWDSHMSLHVYVCVFSAPHTCANSQDYMSICGHACVVNLCTIKCLPLCVWVEWGGAGGGGSGERNGCIFRLASMRWDSTLQGLASSQTPLLPRKHAAAWHPRGATQFNRFWPFFLTLGRALCGPHHRDQILYSCTRRTHEHTHTYEDLPKTCFQTLPEVQTSSTRGSFMSNVTFTLTDVERSEWSLVVDKPLSQWWHLS